MSKDINWLKEQMNMPFTSIGERFTEGHKAAFNHLVSQVEQPELPEIPQFLVGIIDEARKFKDVEWAIYTMKTSASQSVRNWINHNEVYTQKEARDIVTRAYLDGYTVEEKKYVVKTESGTYLILDDESSEWDYTGMPEDKESVKYATRFNKERANAAALLFGGTAVEVTK